METIAPINPMSRTEVSKTRPLVNVSILGTLPPVGHLEIYKIEINFSKIFVSQFLTIRNGLITNLTLLFPLKNENQISEKYLPLLLNWSLLSN